jgi:peptidoglycan/LPS O-acetylase OafA/YrhL
MGMNGRLSQPARRYELDWLRVGAILMVFVFHSSRFFDTDNWHVKNPTT